MNVFTLVLLCASSLFSANALAQWQWIDAQGRKVFSDLPPPMQVPADHIVKQPSGAKAAAAAPAARPSAAAPAPASAPRSTGIDQDLQTRKTAEDAEKARREQAQAEALAKKQAQARQDNCARAKTAQMALADGRLLSYTNPQGERVFMDDTARAAERQRVQEAITSECGQ